MLCTSWYELIRAPATALPSRNVPCDKTMKSVGPAPTAGAMLPPGATIAAFTAVPVPEMAVRVVMFWRNEPGFTTQTGDNSQARATPTVPQALTEKSRKSVAGLKPFTVEASAPAPGAMAVGEEHVDVLRRASGSDTPPARVDELDGCPPGRANGFRDRGSDRTDRIGRADPVYVAVGSIELNMICAAMASGQVDHVLAALRHEVVRQPTSIAVVEDVVTDRTGDDVAENKATSSRRQTHWGRGGDEGVALAPPDGSSQE